MKCGNRRTFIRNGLASALALSSRAAVVGVPASFLLTGQAQAASGNPKFTIIAQSTRGEAINTMGPGTYDSNTIARVIDHVVASEVPNSLRRTINGREYTAQDLASAANVQLGSQTVRAARVWNALPQGFRNNMSYFWMRTGANAHQEFPAIKTCMGALKNDLNPNRNEELASAIALEMAASLGTTTTKPIFLDGSGRFLGTPLSVSEPTRIKDLFSLSTNSQISPENYGALYDQAIDSLYDNLKQNGTRGQRTYLDNHALTRSQAQQIGDQIGSLISDVNSNDFVNEIKTALALIRLRITPVVTLKHDFSRDNHGDENLVDEVSGTLDTISGLNLYWQLLNQYNLQNEVNFFTLDVFGRTVKRNSRRGRDHYGNLTLGLCHGSDFKGSVIGGFTQVTSRGNNLPAASGINSSTGASSNNSDISPGGTIGSYGCTMMMAAGVSDERLQLRFPTSKAVTGAFS
ncbi:MAG: hypothetical protein AAFZ92_02835 [Pseudomonadota bacterium]